MKRVEFRASSKTRARSEIIANSAAHEFDITVVSDGTIDCTAELASQHTERTKEILFPPFHRTAATLVPSRLAAGIQPFSNSR
jgi:hypothetical protein